MATYKNGEVPRGVLIAIASGTNTGATLVKHNRLVQQKSGG